MQRQRGGLCLVYLRGSEVRRKGSVGELRLLNGDVSNRGVITVCVVDRATAGLGLLQLFINGVCVRMIVYHL